MTSSLTQLVIYAVNHQASDIHLESGMPPAFRINGKIEINGEPIKHSIMKEWMLNLLGQERWQYLGDNKSIDLSEEIAGLRCRLNIFFSFQGLGCALRILRDDQLSIATSNLHPHFTDIANIARGLVLVCGSTGAGKSTTLATLLSEVSRSKAFNIVTIENPIEYVIRSRKSFVRQREVGVSVNGFSEGVRDALREDPDVIFVGEVRDHETTAAVLTAAETGHLVYTSIHASSVREALGRLTSTFSAQNRSIALHQLSGCLQAVICQRLQYLPRFKIRVPVCEILMPTTASRSLILADKLSSIQDTLQTGRDAGSMTYDWYEQWLNAKNDFYIPDIKNIKAKPLKVNSYNPEVWSLAKPKARQAELRSKSNDYEIDEAEDLDQIISDLEKDM